MHFAQVEEVICLTILQSEDFLKKISFHENQLFFFLQHSCTVHNEFGIQKCSSQAENPPKNYFCYSSSQAQENRINFTPITFDFRRVSCISKREASCYMNIFQRYIKCRWLFPGGLQRDVVFWLTNTALVYEPKCGGKVGVLWSQQASEYSYTQEPK